MKYMKPVAEPELPVGPDWLYEIKYDGFRCMLEWSEKGIRLTSKNGKDLTANFPEITTACREMNELAKPFLPLALDGELAVLNHRYAGNFSWIQKRGRLKNQDKIAEASQIRPATLVVFDMLLSAGSSLEKKSCASRRKQLEKFFSKLAKTDALILVDQYTDPAIIQQIAFDYQVEGIVAKRAGASYSPGKQHHDWLKIKNWRTVHCFLTEWDSSNDYFNAEIYAENGSAISIGKVKHGLDSETFQALKQAFAAKGSKNGDVYALPPAVCSAVNTLDLYEGEVREANFAGILPGEQAGDATARRLKRDLAMLPEELELSNPDKVFWPGPGYMKEDLVTYVRSMAPYMLPFLQNRALTLIRFPDGIEGESFFQKHLPSYAPGWFTERHNAEGEQLIVCNSTLPLLWCANHGAIEYHIPFNRLDQERPAEIVFDLDPAEREQFSHAVKAALLIKQLTDDLGLISFIKTSGSRGLQIHIPLPENSLTYEQTAVCTQAIALTVEQAQPELFTTERLKKKRHGRLYLDYVQHGPGKTIVAPYSPRRVPEAAVAAPLFWHEVNDKLEIGQFTIGNVLERVKLLGCPFAHYEQAGQTQNLSRLLALIGG